MNPETDELLERLEQATSRQPTDRRQLDADTRLLRESWESLSRLLEAADRGADPPQLNRLRYRQPPRRLLAWVIASAASLAAMLAIGWYAGSPDHWRQEESFVTNESPKPGPVPTPTLSDETDATQSAELAWDDEFDDRLAQVRYALWQAQDAPGYSDGRWRHVQDNVEQVTQQWTGDSL